MFKKIFFLTVICLLSTFGQLLKAQIAITSTYVKIPGLQFSGPAKNEIIIDAVKSTVKIQGTVSKGYLIVDISEDSKTFTLKDFSNQYLMMFFNANGAEMLGFVDSESDKVEYIFSIDGIISLKK